MRTIVLCILVLGCAPQAPARPALESYDGPIIDIHAHMNVQEVRIQTSAVPLLQGRSLLREGTSRYEIEPAFFQPSRNSHVLGWYTTSGS
jgi:hypothetical protein